MAGAGTFSEHVVQASLPVFKICLLGCVGALLAACGVLDQHGRRTLSKLIYFVFTPALTFSKLAPVLTARHLLLWMPLAVNMFLSVGVGLLLGVLLLLVVGAPPWFRKHVVVATALGNAGNLPLVLVAALLRESGGVIFEGQDVSVDLAIAYVAMGIWAATLTHFTVGTHFLKLPDWHSSSSSSSLERDGAADRSKGGGYAALEPTAVGPIDNMQQQQKVPKPVLATKPIISTSSSSNSLDGTLSDESSSPECSVELTVLPAGLNLLQEKQLLQKQQQQEGVGTAHQIFLDGSSRSMGWPDRQQQQGYLDVEHGEKQMLLSKTGDLSNSYNSSGGGTNASAGHHGGSTGQPWPDKTLQQQQQQSSQTGSSTMQRCWCCICTAAISLGRFFWSQASPPMVGCLLAIAVGMTKPVRDQLFAPEGHLLMLQDCISMFSDCCIPCLLLMMGATLSKGPGKACPPWRVVVGVCGARLLVLPVLGTGWILLAHKTGWLVAPDSMFLLVMLIQNAVPTALNVHTLATLHANREEEVGALLFWQYLSACLTVPAALMFFLWLLKTPALSVGQ